MCKVSSVIAVVCWLAAPCASVAQERSPECFPPRNPSRTIREVPPNNSARLIQHRLGWLVIDSTNPRLAAADVEAFTGWRHCALAWKQDEDAILATLFAPILRFAPGERFFPTVPFVAALDNKNNDPRRDSLSDLHDPDNEIAPLFGVGQARAALARANAQHTGDTLRRERLVARTTDSLTAATRLRAAPAVSSLWWLGGTRFEVRLPDTLIDFSTFTEYYTQSVGEFLNDRIKRRAAGNKEPVPQDSLFPTAAVFYKVCDLSERDVRRVWNFLRSDQQAWSRFDFDTIPAALDPAVDSAMAAEQARRDRADSVISQSLLEEAESDTTGTAFEQRLKNVYLGQSATPRRDGQEIGRQEVVNSMRRPCASDTVTLRVPDAIERRARKVSRPQISDTTALQAVIYYFYYLYDRGLKGKGSHPNDRESVVLFMPRDPNVRRKFRILVGNSHKDPAANNVLVLAGPDASDARYWRTNILVELGGHASAPDLPPFGQYNAGLDVNWHMSRAWGTRDVQATAGLGFLGSYRQEMSFPRDSRYTVSLFPKIAVNLKQPALDSLEEFSPKYTLLPGPLLHDVYDQLAEYRKSCDSLRQLTTTSGNPTPVIADGASGARTCTWTDSLQSDQAADSTGQARELSQRLSRLEVALREDLDTLTGRLLGGRRPHGYLPDTATPELAAALYHMARWNDDVWNVTGKVRTSRVSAGEHKIWEHGLYTNPTAAFRTHLFRPRFRQVTGFSHNLSRLFTVGGTYFPGGRDGFALHLGIITDVPNPGGFLNIPGYLVLHGGPYIDTHGDAGARPFLAVMYEHEYADVFSWFVKVSLVPNRSRVALSDNAANWTITAGPSFWIPASKFGLKNFHLRPGLRMDLRGGTPKAGTLTWDLQVEYRIGR